MTTYRWSTFAMASLGALAFTFGGAGSASAGLFHHGSSGGGGGHRMHGSSGSYGSYGGSSGSYGSYGGSSGSYGSYGGSSGSYGGYGGSSGSYGGYGGSSGSWGSYGSSGSYGGYGGSSGSWGSYGSSGSWGSYGSSGSYGGYGGGYGGGYAANVGTDKAPTNTRVAYLNVKVPADAKVYLQDQRMTLTGTQRRFVTPELTKGQHVYTVRVELERNGKTLTKTTKALVTAGQEVEVAVSFDATTNARVAAVAPASSR